MKKAFIPLVALILIFGGCVRSSTLKKSINETETARQETQTAEEANKSHLEEIASIKKDIADLRTRNESLVEGNMKKAEEIASLEALLKGKRGENEALRKDLDTLRAAGHALKGEKRNNPVDRGIFEELLKTLREDIDMGSLSILHGSKTLSLLLSEKALFEQGKAELLPEGKALLQRISSTRDNLSTAGQAIRIRPIAHALKGRDKKAFENLAARRGAVITRFLNERSSVKKALSNGLPYEETTGDTLSGFAVELIFPYSK